MVVCLTTWTEMSHSSSSVQSQELYALHPKITWWARVRQSASAQVRYSGSVGSCRVCGYWLNKARGEAVDEGQDWTEKTQVGS